MRVWVSGGMPDCEWRYACVCVEWWYACVFVLPQRAALLVEEGSGSAGLDGLAPEQQAAATRSRVSERKESALDEYVPVSYSYT